MRDAERYFSLPDEFRSGVIFRYWHFYDYPRNIELALDGRHFYMHSPFLEDEDEFANYYNVFELVGSATEQEMKRKRRWRFYPPEDMLRPIGRIPIAEIGFSRDHRSSFALPPLLWLLARRGYPEISARTQEYETEPRARAERTNWWPLPG